MFESLIQFIREWYKSDDFIPLHEPIFSNLDKEYVVDSIDSTFVSSVGAYVNRFEKELARYVGSRRAVATVNGTAALQVALRLVGVKEGVEVITQPLTFVATANAIKYNNSFPIFIDVDRETMGMNPDSLVSFLNRFGIKKAKGVFNKHTGRKIAAILPVHIFGNPCKIHEIVEISEKWGIPVVEDAAEAIGAKRNDKMCGTYGKLGIFSLNGNKAITCGGGGAIVTNDDSLADKAKFLTTTAKENHPWEYIHECVGYNFRMPNLNAALACAQLAQLSKFLEDKRKLSYSYDTFYRERELGTFFVEPKDCRSNYWLNTVILKNRLEKELMLKETNESGIMTRPVWRLLTDLKMYRHCQKEKVDNARWIQERAVNIPSSARSKCLQSSI